MPKILGGCWCFATVVFAADPLTGGPGWVEYGLLGAVLGWLMLIHLPAKDKQLAFLMEKQSEERERERVSRHGVANKMQEAIAEISVNHKEELTTIADAFSKSIESQTVRLESAIKSSCLFQHPPKGKGE